MKRACVKRVFAKTEVNKSCNKSIQNTSKHARNLNTKHIICSKVSISSFVFTGMFMTQPIPWPAEMLELASDQLGHLLAM